MPPPPPTSRIPISFSKRARTEGPAFLPRRPSTATPQACRTPVSFPWILWAGSRWYGSDTDGDQILDTLLLSQSVDAGATFSANLKIAGGIPPTFFIFPMGLRHDSGGRLHLLFAETDSSSSAAAIFYLRG